MTQEPKPVDTTAINDAIKAAAQKWVGTFSEIPKALVAKLCKYSENICEVTPTEGEDFDSRLPMWGTMWAFKSGLDNAWLEDNLEIMAKCGFRIYMQEDYGFIFGIDGAGYDFYEAHWIPLYMAYLDRQ